MTSNRTPTHKAIRRSIAAGVAVIVLMFGGVAGWAMTTTIAGAIVAEGTLVIDGSVKKVQHSTGGIVGEIRVADGQRIKAGEIVLRLDDTLIRASVAIIRASLDDFAIRRARLLAERDGAGTVTFPEDIVARSFEASIANAMTNEIRLFDMRRLAVDGQIGQIATRIEQLRNEIAGLHAQSEALAAESAIVDRELSGVRILAAKGLAPMARLTSLEKDAARLAGEQGRISASIARAEQQIAEAELQIHQVAREVGREAAGELREIDVKAKELAERLIAADDQMRRMDIRAPQDGIVHDLAVHTVGGVVAGGETLLVVVPDAAKLVVEARIAPKDIDQIHIDQEVGLRFSAFSQRTTSEASGVVAQVAADVTHDERTGGQYYTIRVAFDADTLDDATSGPLVPGMPVELFVKTGDRQVASYLVKPLSDQLMRAFREE